MRKVRAFCGVSNTEKLRLFAHNTIKEGKVAFFSRQRKRAAPAPTLTNQALVISIEVQGYLYGIKNAI